MILALRRIGLFVFAAIMLWGLKASLYDMQMHGETPKNWPMISSPVLPDSVIKLMVYGVPILAILLSLATLFEKMRKPPNRVLPPKDDEPDHYNRMSHVDDDYIAAAAARFRAERQSSGGQSHPGASPPTPRPSGGAPKAFGRR